MEAVVRDYCRNLGEKWWGCSRGGQDQVGWQTEMWTCQSSRTFVTGESIAWLPGLYCCGNWLAGVAVTRKGAQEEDAPCFPHPPQMATVLRYVTVWGYITVEAPLLGNYYSLRGLWSCSVSSKNSLLDFTRNIWHFHGIHSACLASPTIEVS